MRDLRFSIDTARGRRGAVGLLLASLIAFAVVFAAGAGDNSRAADAEPADTVFKNGRVLLFPDADTDRMSSNIDWASAVAVTGDRITYVGDDQGAQAQVGPDTEVVDLGGRLMMPGLGDGHLHGGAPPTCDLRYEGGSVETVLGRIKTCLTRADQAGYLDSNYVLSVGNFMGEGMLPVGTRLTRHLLDRLSADPEEDEFGTGTTRPIVVRNMDFHKLYVNTKGINNAGLTAATPDPTDGFIGRDEDGFPNGLFSDYSANWGPSAPAVPDAAYTGLKTNMLEISSKGITSVFNPMASLARMKRLADDGLLDVRFNGGISGAAIRGVSDPDDLKNLIAGYNTTKMTYDSYANPASPGTIAVDTVKIFCDGVAEYPGQTASMIKPYRTNIGTDENPIWVPSGWRGEEPSCEDSEAAFKALDKARFSIHVHAIGDRAVQVTLDNYEEMEKTNPKWDRRPTITHVQFVDDNDIPRFGELGVIASMSQQWNQRDAWNVDATVGYVAPDRMDRQYPTKGFIDGGATIAQGSDWPVTDLLPWGAIEQAVTRTGEVNPAKAIYDGPQNPGDAITLEQAVKSSTIGVAYQMHQDDQTGSIETGKFADMIILKDDFFALPENVQSRLDAAEKGVDDAAAEVDAAAAALSAAEAKVAPAESAAKSAKAKATAAKKAAKKAARQARGKKGKKGRKARANAKRKAKASRKAQANAKRAATALSKSRAAVEAARTRVTAADTAKTAAAAEMTAAEAAAADAKAEKVKTVSDTKVLNTILGGEVVYAGEGSLLPEEE